MKQRGIKRVKTVQYQANSSIHRNGLILEPGNWEEYDPFLLLAEDFFQTGTFALHPHRGIETVTYVIEGTLNHYDNKAGEGKLESGDVQWMTAGKGVIHKEDPAQGSTVHSLQLWINLPSKQKMIDPSYQNLKSKDMPVRVVEGGLVRVFSGSSKGITSNTINQVPITMVEIVLEPGAHVKQDLPGSYNGFLYILEGKGSFGVDKTEAFAGQVLFMSHAENDEESEIIIRANESADESADESDIANAKLRVLLYAGQPIQESVEAYGPFVMNTKEEIKQAIADYQAGKFDE